MDGDGEQFTTVADGRHVFHSIGFRKTFRRNSAKTPSAADGISDGGEVERHAGPDAAVPRDA